MLNKHTDSIVSVSQFDLGFAIATYDFYLWPVVGGVIHSVSAIFLPHSHRYLTPNQWILSSKTTALSLLVTQQFR